MKKITFLYSLILVVTTNTAYADCLGTAQGLVSTCLADTGDDKSQILKEKDSPCDKETFGNISTAWRDFNSAVESRDENQIIAAANTILYNIQGRSDMYTSCWDAMKRNCDLVGDAVDGAIVVVSDGA
jgi:hypothetical protein